MIFASRTPVPPIPGSPILSLPQLRIGPLSSIPLRPCRRSCRKRPSPNPPQNLILKLSAESLIHNRGYPPSSDRSPPNPEVRSSVMDAYFRRKAARPRPENSIRDASKLHKALDATTCRSFVGLNRRDMYARKRDP